MAARLALSPAEVIELHCQVEYDVFAIGFLPGFPYAGYLPPALAGLARRDSPRLRVPAGSVAIAGRQTAIYPIESPGGWHLLGTTPLCIADPESGYFPIRAGDRIRFEPISASEFEGRRMTARSDEWLARPSRYRTDIMTARPHPDRSTSTPTWAKAFPTTGLCSSW